MRSVVDVLKETWKEFDDDHAPRLAAALAYYIIFSLAPLLIVVTAIAGAVFDATRVRQEVYDQVQNLVGQAGAQTALDIMMRANVSKGGVLATILGGIAIVVGSGGVFLQLREALDAVWGVKARKQPFVKGFLKEHVFSFALVVGAGFLLLVSLVVNAAIAAMVHALHDRMPGSDTLWQVGYYLLSDLSAWLVFAAAFMVLPRAHIRWRDVVEGGLWTALLFSLGQVLLGLYLGRGTLGNAYGAAGSFVVLLVWIYYSSQVLLFGAELTQVLARRRGAEILPKANAEAA
jgi:membrane protein